MTNTPKPATNDTSNAGALRLVIVGVAIIVATQVPAARNWFTNRLNTVSTVISTSFVNSIQKELPTPATTTTTTTTVATHGS